MPNPTKIVNQSIILANLPTNPTDAANKQYVDNIYDAAIINSGTPGIIGYFATSSAPTGWVRANGAVLLISNYQALFDVLPKQGNGNTIWWQAGDGPLNFRLPDLRGLFPRGLDEGRGIDPGRGIGRDQSSMLAAHEHPNSATAVTSIGVTPNNGAYRQAFISVTRTGGDAIAGIAPGANFSDNNASSISRGNISASTTVGINNAVAGGFETRPVNISLLACIKF